MARPLTVQGYAPQGMLVSAAVRQRSGQRARLGTTQRRIKDHLKNSFTVTPPGPPPTITQGLGKRAYIPRTTT